MPYFAMRPGSLTHISVEERTSKGVHDIVLHIEKNTKDHRKWSWKHRRERESRERGEDQKNQNQKEKNRNKKTVRDRGQVLGTGSLYTRSKKLPTIDYVRRNIRRNKNREI